MRKTFAACLLAAGLALVAVSPVEAQRDHDRGGHRGAYGHNRPNRPPMIGRHYPGHGYWDGRRYRQHRYRHHNGWRYR